jgi:hypothetical protein
VIQSCSFAWASAPCTSHSQVLTEHAQLQALLKTLPLWLAPERVGYLLTFDDVARLDLLQVFNTPLKNSQPAAADP